MNFGIEAASYYVPSLYLEIQDLAAQRNIEAAKLEKGLGLHKMAFPDVHEDAATIGDAKAEYHLRFPGTGITDRSVIVVPVSRGNR